MLQGGEGGEPNDILASAELYDPASGNWTFTGSLNIARVFHTATLLLDGKVLVAGGFDGSCNSGAELYDPASGTWSVTDILNTGREYHTATLLQNGEVLVAAGWVLCNGGYLASAELFSTAMSTPTPTPTPTPTATPTPTPPIRVTVQTNPAGLSFTVDGTTYTATHRFSWVAGSSHTIATTSPQSGGTGVQYIWAKWNDHGAISHTVAPTTNTTYTATFRTQYYLTMTAGTGGRVTPASAWKNSGAVISISATPNSGFSFSNWTGSGTGSYSGPNNPASITMGGPITETATFIHN